MQAINMRRGTWDANATLVMALPAALDPMPFNKLFLQAFSNREVRACQNSEGVGQ